MGLHVGQMLGQRLAQLSQCESTVGPTLSQPLALRRANMMAQRRPDLHLYQRPTLACNVRPTILVSGLLVKRIHADWDTSDIFF